MKMEDSGSCCSRLKIWTLFPHPIAPDIHSPCLASVYGDKEFQHFLREGERAHTAMWAGIVGALFPGLSRVLHAVREPVFFFWRPLHRCRAGRSCPHGHGSHDLVQAYWWLDRHPHSERPRQNHHHHAKHPSPSPPLRLLPTETQPNTQPQLPKACVCWIAVAAMEAPFDSSRLPPNRVAAARRTQRLFSDGSCDQPSRMWFTNRGGSSRRPVVPTSRSVLDRCHKCSGTEVMPRSACRVQKVKPSSRFSSELNHPCCAPAACNPKRRGSSNLF